MLLFENQPQHEKNKIKKINKQKIVTGEHQNNVSVVRAVHGSTTDTVKLRPPAFSENPELSKIPSVEPEVKGQSIALHA